MYESLLAMEMVKYKGYFLGEGEYSHKIENEAKSALKNTCKIIENYLDSYYMDGVPLKIYFQEKASECAMANYCKDKPTFYLDFAGICAITDAAVLQLSTNVKMKDEFVLPVGLYRNCDTIHYYYRLFTRDNCDKTKRTATCGAVVRFDEQLASNIEEKINLILKAAIKKTKERV